MGPDGSVSGVPAVEILDDKPILEATMKRPLLVLFWLASCCLVLPGLAVAAPVAQGHDVDEATSTLETATFSMFCYWTGEATLGKVDGVVASRIGHWGGQEIVQVDYDPARTDRERLAKALVGQRSFYAVLAESNEARGQLAGAFSDGQIRSVSGEPEFIEPKHSLRTRYPKIADLELTEAQAIALNSWAYFGGPMPEVLSADQKRQLAGD